VAQNLEGYAELQRKLRSLASPKQQSDALRASVRTPMREVMKRAKVAIGKISPGKRQLHRTYKGRLVSSGFASRNMRVIVVSSKDKQAAWALLGVRKEAFYALQFFELGTAYIQKQPWLTPTFYAMKAQSIAGIATVMRKWIDKVAKSKGS
jgi:HK97 gp10 family phage protein